jgi:hypothetical protein
LVRDAASGKAPENARAFSYTPIVRDRDNNRARQIRKSHKNPRKPTQKILPSSHFAITPFARL